MPYMPIFNKVRELGYPCVYHSYIDPPNLPYTIILATYNNDIIADNQNYKGVVNVQLELYHDNSTTEHETAIENMFNGLGIPYGKSRAFIDSERLHQVVYQIQLLEE